ncbi:ribose transport system substrate-binding protein [Aminobacter lissarensis]|uniref:Ribose transport system substrate-binding protein n=1 Tax=Aminobacter carboxidus TaxID=376165 RepID=A0A8E1WJV3_9HYPH|nr:sugar ABC transporter substrate-binding protein [Aminobacter lissarensis]MBB6469862.1 ribose transport system substrate-binding protein [Aminobacter lissarensis]
MSDKMWSSLSRRNFVALGMAGLAAISITLPQPAFAQSPVIAVSFPNSSLQGAVIATLEAAKKKGGELGYQVVVDDPGTDLKKQINTLNTWIEQKVAVIVCVTLNPAVFESVAKKARSAGIKWITYAEKLQNQDATVGFSQYESAAVLGEYAGKWINSNLDGKANVVILGYEGAFWGRSRADGIAKGLTSVAPGATIVARQDAISATEGLETTRSILQAHPEVNVILGIEDPATEGAYKAWIAAGRDKADPKAFIGGMDGTPGALKLLRSGDTIYRASMALPLIDLGEAIATTADKLARGETVAERIIALELVEAKSPLADKYLKQQGIE